MPSANIGQLGPQQGEAVGFEWKWYYSAAGWIIWLALILTFIIPKANRNIRALLILIPVVIVSLLWVGFIKIARMNTTDELQFDIIFHSFTVGVTVLWLIAYCFKRFGGLIRFLLSFATVMVVSGLGTLAYSTELSLEMALFLILFALMTFTMLIAIILSRRYCGNTYNPIRFLLWLVLWMLLGSLATSSVFIIIGFIIFSSGPGSGLAILIFIFAGMVFGLFLYLLNLPYFILGFVHPFFRERFCSSLGVQTNQ